MLRREQRRAQDQMESSPRIAEGGEDGSGTTAAAIAARCKVRCKSRWIVPETPHRLLAQSFGMNALPRYQVWNGDTSGQHSHSHLTALRFWVLVLNDSQCVGPAVVGDDHSR